jgi:hypothetical protein
MSKATFLSFFSKMFILFQTYINFYFGIFTSLQIAWVKNHPYAHVVKIIDHYNKITKFNSLIFEEDLCNVQNIVTIY